MDAAPFFDVRPVKEHASNADQCSGVHEVFGAAPAQLLNDDVLWCRHPGLAAEHLDEDLATAAPLFLMMWVVTFQEQLDIERSLPCFPNVASCPGCGLKMLLRVEFKVGVEQ